jgi:hypothetical protein
MGFISKQTRAGAPAWCVHNEPTKKIIRAGGRDRCYRKKQDALDVWSKLDCKYTGRRCDRVPKRFKFPKPI